MPRHLVAKILANRDEVIGEKKQATFLFADVVGSTTLGETLDQEDFKAIMDGALQRMIDQVHRYEGTVGQLRGDEVFGLFGVPIVHEDDPERALRAALGIKASIGEYAQSLLESKGIPKFIVRITLNTGDVVVGEIGSDLHAEYTAMGDPVNTTAKMQAVAPPGSLVLAGETYKLVRRLVDAHSLGEVELKGKKRRVRLYEVTGIRQARRKPRGLEGLASSFVGRAAETSGLQQCFENLRAGCGQIVFVSGHAGIGKTRLVSEARSRMSKGRLVWLEGRCLSFGKSLTYHPFVSALRGWLRIGEDAPPDVAWARLREALDWVFGENAAPKEVEEHLAVLLNLESSAGEHGSSDDPEEVRRGIERSFGTLVRRIASVRPLVLFLDDIHWADSASLELAKSLMTCADDAAFMLLFSSRPDPRGGEAALKSFAEETHAKCVEAISLSPLGPDESSELLGNLLRVTNVPEGLRDSVVERAEGNPLFVEELLRSLIDRGILVRKRGHWETTEESAAISVPRLLVGIIDDRIDGLTDGTKRLLRAGSVLGRSFSKTVLAHMMRDLGTTDIETGLEELARLELVTAAGDEDTSGRHYTFKHDLIREVAYNGLLADARVLWHRRAGRALEAFYGERTDQGAAILARHFGLAEEWATARDYLLIAAERAQAVYSNDEAIGFLTQALDLVAKVEDPRNERLRFDILRRRAAVLGLIGRTDEEAGDLQAMKTLCHSGTPCPELAEVSLLLSDHARRTGRFEEALLEAERGLELFEKLDDSRGRAKAQAAIGAAQARLGKLDDARAALQKALDLFVETSDRAGEAAVRKSLGTTHARLGAFEDAISNYSRAGDLFRDLEDRRGESEILGNLGSLRYLRAEYEDAAVSFSEARRLFHELGVARNEAKCVNNLGMAYLALGDYARARPTHERALDLYSDVGDEAGRANALSNLGIALHALGVDGDPAYEGEPVSPSSLLEEALQSHDRAFDIYRQTGDQVGAGRTRFNIGSVLLSLGKPSEALAQLGKARDEARELGMSDLEARALAAMGRAYLQQERSSDALACSTEAASMLEDGRASELEEIRFSLARALLACGKPEEAAEQRKQAINEIRAKADRIRDPAVRNTYLSAYRRLLGE